MEWKDRSVYLGNDLKLFNLVRDTLEAEKVPYKYHVRNHQGQFFGLGRGTIRGRTGSLGMSLEHAYEYEIKVSEKEEERARHLINKAMQDAASREE
ncbi:MAG TPA: hypothetical protein IAB44_16015 [Candidatus Limivivens intestinipullorum]|uniref:DUF2007 domain-containing protein n=1 Tax=Candidatus Limivivens intestinipullorum TaxID=2840858 RepID=A0A9D1EWB6_9FIRM|nr:hypothetical protein [Candidatus Limivivens intestinipullorum]